MAGISITLGGNFSKLDELRAKADKTAKDVAKSFSDKFTGKNIFAGLTVAAGAAFAGVVASVKVAINAGGKLNDMMARTGAEGKGLVVMQRAFENAGVAADAVPAALNKMQKALAGVNEEGEPTATAFAEIGLSVSDLLRMDPVKAFQATSEAISKIENPAQRVALAMQIFGKSGGELLAVLTDRTAFSGAAEQVGGLAQTLADNAAAFDAIGDSFGTFETKVQQVGAEVAVSLLPQLNALSTWMSETDFSSVGQGIGDVVTKLISWGEALATIIKYTPLAMGINAGAEAIFGGGPDKEKAKQMAESMAPSNYQKGDGAESANVSKGRLGYTDTPMAVKSIKDIEKEAKEQEKAAKAAEKKAETERKAAEEKEKSRSAAQAEYNLESAILSAKIKGDAKRLESLEREKKIREEMKRLESAGFSAEEARKPAEAKVDAEKKAADLEEKRKKAEEDRKSKLQDAQSELKSLSGQKDSLKFESRVGTASSMQRIGGGGVAVSSGLDYQRQSNDLQRQMTEQLSIIAGLLTKAPEGA